ncbi:hypothetical protein K432DRAFT_423341 [Lepidopterella palustris CBS 459.81]|uniref:SWR1-complex protein 3 domain-containing protein n=1 Tax=Lepidopterella palustris CBS 459.81 TaxID=1314670 RepID=A0A8E2EGA3_9PEZI|nr:hypothetical protein K432DRAFT_423341 [Lepidopterella palustris CBS 459.81]
MSEKRRNPGRATRGDSLKRKKTVATPKEATPAPETPVQELEPKRETLPVKLAADQPLPTLQEPQPSDLSTQLYQSIKESGVLSASLKRSREIWLSGCHFKKYYTKTTMVKKVKDRTAEDKEAMARDKLLLKNMVKIGDGNLTIDPHIFTISLYTTKEATNSAAQKRVDRYAPGFSQYQPLHPPSTPQYKAPVPQPPHPKQQAQQKQRPSNPLTPNPTPAAQAAPDPVIHMLAQRAGTDAELKAVMKIVAAGQATPQQLEFFQGHINELTRILEAQKAAQKKALVASASPTPPVPPPQSAPAQPTPPAPSSTSSGPVASPYPPQTPYSQFGGPPPSHHSSPYPPLGPPQRPAMRPVFFEFHEGNGDRLYFPEYSILEFLPGGRQVRASFLVTKSKQDMTISTPTPSTPTPSTTTPSKTAPATNTNTPVKFTPDPDRKPDLYQPVTALLASVEHYVLECLSRAVHPPDEVEKYMNEIFDTAEPAEEGYLALRLPRDGEESWAGDTEGATKSGEPRVSITTPVMTADSVQPERRKMAVGRQKKS